MRGTTARDSGLHRYDSDFSKAGAWPFVTRLVHNSIGVSLTRLAKATHHPIDILDSEQDHGGHRDSPPPVHERLDWAMVNTPWTTLFPGALVEHLDYYKSDHRALKPLMQLILCSRHCRISIGVPLFSLIGIHGNLEVLRRKFHQLKNKPETLNTKFFHARATSRQNTNKIRKLTDGNGQLVESDQQLAAMVSNYFHHLFRANPIDAEATDVVLSTITPSISADINTTLVRPFTSGDVLLALKSMGPDKSPGLDSMSAIFYQHYWLQELCLIFTRSW
ncbi:hypothetical protein TorRG33x02_279590 [Trema orientale]|uniref:Endonuclease/exonuclease/phosphatase n=1 Tax=Trema orientale TaxID=63057 RepID=A0A2P5CMT2_TREOI|nr:hypothetical protein TorRG33x02_279590 [Trema orientale]